jgi:hypothetical protein
MTVAHAFGMFIDGVVTKDYLDATLDARFAAQDAKFEKRFDAVDQRFLEFEMKFEQRFAAIDQRFAAIDQRFVQQDLKFEKRFSAIETDIGSLKTAVGSISRQMYLLMGGVFIPLVLKLGELL